MRKLSRTVVTAVLAVLVLPIVNVNVESYAQKRGWDLWLVTGAPWLLEQWWFWILLWMLAGATLTLWLVDTLPQFQEQKGDAPELERTADKVLEPETEAKPEAEGPPVPQRQQRKRPPDWWEPAARNVSVLRSLHYIATRSWDGQAPLAELHQAGVELRDRAAEGELQIWGRPHRHNTIAKLENRYWTEHGFDWKIYLDDETNFRTAPKFGTRGQPHLDLQTCKERVEELWPP